MAVTILSAEKGGGKTSFLLEWVTHLQQRGDSVGGVAQPAVFKQGARIGYDLLDLRSGFRRPLARLADQASATVGMYQFDDEVLEKGKEAIVEAAYAELGVIAIDEIGPLEFRGGGWARAIDVALDRSIAARELIVVVRPKLVDQLADRFPSSLWKSARRLTPPWPQVDQL